MLQPHAYWRLKSVSNQGADYWTMIGKMEWRATQGGPAIDVAGTALAFLASDTGYVSLADTFGTGTTDGGILFQGNDPAYIGVQFPTPVLIAEVVIDITTVVGYYDAPRTLKTFVMEFSDDGITWTETARVSTSSGDWSDKVHTALIAEAAPVDPRARKYWRFKGIQNRRGWNSSLLMGRIEFHETIGGPNIAGEAVSFNSSSFSMAASTVFGPNVGQGAGYLYVNANMYIGLVFDTPRLVKEMVLDLTRAGWSFNSDIMPAVFKVQHSVDGTTWVDAAGFAVYDDSAFPGGIFTGATVDEVPPIMTLDPPAGQYHTTQAVTIELNEAGTVYYTTDGTEPTVASAEYVSSIPISHTSRLRALAVDTAGNHSGILNVKYVIDPVITQFRLERGNKNNVHVQADPGTIVLTQDDTSIHVADEYGTVAVISDTHIGPYQPVGDGKTIWYDTTDISGIVVRRLTTAGWVECATPPVEQNFRGFDPEVWVTPEGAITPVGELLTFHNTNNLPMYYTTDGSVPTIVSTAYTVPIVFNSPCELKILATDGVDVVTGTIQVVVPNPIIITEVAPGDFAPAIDTANLQNVSLLLVETTSAYTWSPARLADYSSEAYGQWWEVVTPGTGLQDYSANSTYTLGTGDYVFFILLDSVTGEIIAETSVIHEPTSVPVLVLDTPLVAAGGNIEMHVVDATTDSAWFLIGTNDGSDPTYENRLFTQFVPWYSFGTTIAQGTNAFNAVFTPDNSQDQFWTSEYPCRGQWKFRLAWFLQDGTLARYTNIVDVNVLQASGFSTAPVVTEVPTGVVVNSTMGTGSVYVPVTVDGIDVTVKFTIVV